MFTGEKVLGSICITYRIPGVTRRGGVLSHPGAVDVLGTLLPSPRRSAPRLVTAGCSTLAT